jgi:hypothetical protein
VAIEDWIVTIEDSIAAPESSIVAIEDSIAAPELSIVTIEDWIVAIEDSIAAPELSIVTIEDWIAAPERSIVTIEDWIVASETSIVGSETSIAASEFGSTHPDRTPTCCKLLLYKLLRGFHAVEATARGARSGELRDTSWECPPQHDTCANRGHQTDRPAEREARFPEFRRVAAREIVDTRGCRPVPGLVRHTVGALEARDGIVEERHGLLQRVHREEPILLRPPRLGVHAVDRKCLREPRRHHEHLEAQRVTVVDGNGREAPTSRSQLGEDRTERVLECAYRAQVCERQLPLRTATLDGAHGVAETVGFGTVRIPIAGDGGAAGVAFAHDLIE